MQEIERILNDNKEKQMQNKRLNGLNADSSNNSLHSSNGTSSNSEDDESKNDDNNNTNQKTVRSIVDNGIQNGLIESEYKREDRISGRSDRDEWITVKGDFVMVYAVSTSHISSDCHFAPGK